MELVSSRIFTRKALTLLLFNFSEQFHSLLNLTNRFNGLHLSVSTVNIYSIKAPKLIEQTGLYVHFPYVSKDIMFSDL